MRSVRSASASFLAMALLLASCARQSTQSAATKVVAPLVVSAAASTKEVVEVLATEFSKSHGVEVKVNAGPSNALASQILAGAPADLFLSANAKWADEVKKAGLAA